MSLDSVLGRITEIEGRINQIKSRIGSLSPGADFEIHLRNAEEKAKASSARREPSPAPQGGDRANSLADLPVKMPRITYQKPSPPRLDVKQMLSTSPAKPAANALPGAVANDSKIGSIVLQKSAQHEVDPLLVSAIMAVESDFDPNAVSDKGAMGLMQLMPETASEMGVSNPFNASQNIDGGIRYFKKMLGQFSGDLKLALAAYNAGPNAVIRHGGIPPYDETRNYVMKVMNNYEKLLKQSEAVAGGADALDAAKAEAIKSGSAMTDALFNYESDEEIAPDLE